MKLFSITILLFVVLQVTQSANILFYFGFSTYSHRISVWPLVEALAERGHNVTFFAPYPNKSPNPKVTEVIPQMEYAELPNLLTLRLENGKDAVRRMLLVGLTTMTPPICERFLDNPEVISWADKASFDLVIIDGLYNDCGLGFAYKFGARHALFGTTSLFNWWPDAYGFPIESSSHPDIALLAPIPVSFFTRVFSTLIPLSNRLQRHLYMFPKLETMLREKLKIPDMPSLAELERNTSLILMNAHFSEDLPTTLPPLIVPVGGMQCKDSKKKLPEELLKFIDGDKSGNGFIYISFGSMAKVSEAPEEIKQIFYNTFRDLNMPVVWKWEGPRPKEMPANVFTSEWMPQQDIFAHPKIRAFISHGGLLGIHEATYHGVPIVVMPLFAEQDYNCERINRTGRGIALEIIGLTEMQLKTALTKILTDPSYQNAAKEASRRFRDRPQKPVDTAVWWVEYVLRHEDTSFLRPLGAEQTWYQRRLLDVWAVIFLFLLILLAVSVIVLKKLLRFCCSKLFSSSKQKRNEKLGLNKQKTN